MAACPYIYRVQRIDTVTYEQSVAAPSEERAIELARGINAEEAPRVIHREWVATLEREVAR